jgi:hypothetical protein
MVDVPDTRCSVGDATAETVVAGAPDELQITDDMIFVAAEVLWRFPLLEISEGLAEELAKKMLVRALLVHHKKIDVADLEVPWSQ